MQYVDLRTGQRVDAPEEYDSNIVGAGTGLQIDNIEALRTAGESEEVLRTLTEVGSPASYQASPDSEIIPADDPRFPWDLLQREMPTVRGAIGGGTDIIRTGIARPPNVWTQDFYTLCHSEYKYPSGYTGIPRGVKWNPPTSHGYNGQYYVKGTWGNVYLWNCGYWKAYKKVQNWVCCSYRWHDWDPGWQQNMGPRKWWPKYKCK